MVKALVNTTLAVLSWIGKLWVPREVNPSANDDNAFGKGVYLSSDGRQVIRREAFDKGFDRLLCPDTLVRYVTIPPEFTMEAFLEEYDIRVEAPYGDSIQIHLGHLLSLTLRRGERVIELINPFKATLIYRVCLKNMAISGREVKVQVGQERLMVQSFESAIKEAVERVLNIRFHIDDPDEWQTYSIALSPYFGTRPDRPTVCVEVDCNRTVQTITQETFQQKPPKNTHRFSWTQFQRYDLK